MPPIELSEVQQQQVGQNVQARVAQEIGQGRLAIINLEEYVKVLEAKIAADAKPQGAPDA